MLKAGIIIKKHPGHPKHSSHLNNFGLSGKVLERQHKTGRHSGIKSATVAIWVWGYLEVIK
jgi:hypothetical protein